MTSSENGTKKRVILYIVYAVLGIAAVSMRISEFQGIKIAGKAPDILLVYVVAVSLCSGHKTGAVFGLASGTLAALAGGYRITVAPVFYMLIGYFAVLLAKELLGWTGYEIVPVALTFASAVVCRICYTLVGAVLNTKNVNIFRVLVDSSLPEAAATVIAGVIIFLLIALVMLCRSRVRSRR